MRGSDQITIVLTPEENLKIQVARSLKLHELLHPELHLLLTTVKELGEITKIFPDVSIHEAFEFLASCILVEIGARESVPEGVRKEMTFVLDPEERELSQDLMDQINILRISLGITDWSFVRLVRIYAAIEKLNLFKFQELERAASFILLLKWSLLVELQERGNEGAIMVSLEVCEPRGLRISVE